MSKLITLDSIRQRRNALFNIDDVQELSERYWDNPYTFVPPKDFDIFLSDKAPRTKKEVALWIYTCLYSNGLVGFFSNKANDRNIGHSSQIDFIAESFLEQVGNCIVLGNRSGGKTLAFATLLLLESLFKPGIELAHLGAIELQAKNCFKYYRSMISHRLFSNNLSRRMNSYSVTLKNGSQVNILGGTLAAVNCLHGDTLIECSRDITKYPNGMPIKELVGKTVTVPTIHEKTGEIEYRLAEGVYSGKAPCIKVTTAGDVINNVQQMSYTVCTAEHLFLMLNSHRYKEAKDLIPFKDIVQTIQQPYTKHLNPFNIERTLRVKRSEIDDSIIYSKGTVLAIEIYNYGILEDVYDMQVITLEEDKNYRHNFISDSKCLHNSPHPNKAGVDEIDLMDYNILQEAFSMVSDKGMSGVSGNNWKPALRLTSTRKFSDGSMQKMLNEADAKGFKIYQWNIMDTVEPCRIASSIERNPIRDPDDKDCIVAVSDECLTCKSLDRCLGKAKYANGGMVSLEVMRNMAQILDTVKWDTQWMCNRAEESSLIFSMFDTKIHVIDYNATLANLGIISDKEALEDVAHYNPDIDVVAGQDAGYECPATVIGQYLTDDTFVIFQEIDERRVANSVFIEDYLLPATNEYNIAEFFCDPSNPMLMAEMELNGMYVTPATNSIQLGLDLIKSMFKSNTLYIDKRCTTLIKTLGTYKKRMNSLGSPRPNQDDHHIDAMRYLLMMVADPEDAIIDDIVTSV